MTQPSRAMILMMPWAARTSPEDHAESLEVARKILERRSKAKPKARAKAKR